MAHEVFTEPWAEAFADELRASAAYREAAATWEGALVLAAHADPAQGLEAPRAVYLDLHRGECRDGRVASDADRESAVFILAAGLEVWRRVLDGQIEPIFGVMSGKLKLERGSMARLVPYVGAAKELVAAAGRVQTVFPPVPRL